MENENKIKPCLSCKVVSVCTLCGIGVYLIHTAKMYKRNSKIPLQLLGLGSIGLGIAEIFDISPFGTRQE